MAVSENIVNRRDYLVEWLKAGLKSAPVTIYGEDDRVIVQVQDLMICGIQVNDDYYRIFNASDEWKEKSTNHYEQDADGTWFYYIESADECIAECKELAMFEAKKEKHLPEEGSSAPLVSDYWMEQTKQLLQGVITKQDYQTKNGVTKIRFECYGVGASNRMQVWLNPSSSRTPEKFSVWIGDNILDLNKINTSKGEKKIFQRNGFSEIHVWFFISPDNRLKDIEEAFNFVRDIRRMAECGRDS